MVPATNSLQANVLGVTADDRHRRHNIADFHGRNTVAELVDNSDDIPSRRKRLSSGLGMDALPHQHVSEGHTRRLNLHANFTGVRVCNFVLNKFNSASWSLNNPEAFHSLSRLADSRTKLDCRNSFSWTICPSMQMIRWLMSPGRRANSHSSGG
jgi:hypothetical protein